jgi:3-hydroxyacyl-[acyl-carrier-protein] dehydratase
MDREAIKKIIPHREPFLLVDGVLEVGEERIKGFKNITADEPHFKGHFPGQPVMPGVLMVEALAQLSGILILGKEEHRGKMAFFASITDTRFRRMVVPGEVLTLEAEIVRLKSRVGITKGVASVNGEPACETEMMFSMQPKP